MFSNPNVENHTVLIFLSCQFIRLCSNSHPPKLDSRTDDILHKNTRFLADLEFLKKHISSSDKNCNARVNTLPSAGRRGTSNPL